MISVIIFKSNKQTNGIKVTGHSGYAEAGSDIVCASISALAQSVCVGLENVLKVKPKIKIEDAYLECFVSNNTEKQNEKVQLIFDTFEQSVNAILAGDKTLKKYIKLEVKNEIY